MNAPSPELPTPPLLTRAIVTRYATGATPLAVLGLPFTVYLPPYIAEGGTIPLALIGLLFTATIFWDGIVDPLIGTLVDRFPAGSAPHRRWIVRAALPLLLLLGILVSVGDQLPFALLLLVMLFFYSSFSLYDVAHLAWGSALARSADDSSRLFGAREWSAKLVLIAAFGAPALAQALIPDISLQGRIIAYAALVLVALPAALVALARLPARPIVPEPVIDWRAEIALTLRFQPLLLLLGIQLANAFAFGALTGLFIYYADGVLALGQQSALMLFATFIGGALSTPLWTQIARRLGKRRGMILMVLTLVAIMLTSPLLIAGAIVPALIFSAVLGSGFVGLIFIYGMTADLAAADRVRCGRDRTGFLYAIVNLVQKTGTALAIGSCYVALALIGFTPEAAAASAGPLGLLFIALPSIGWLVVALLLHHLRTHPELA